jgi:hypothetical protein
MRRLSIFVGEFGSAESPKPISKIGLDMCLGHVGLGGVSTGLGGLLGDGGSFVCGVFTTVFTITFDCAISTLTVCTFCCSNDCFFLSSLTLMSTL